MAFHWSLSDSKPHQVSRILLSILTNINNAWIVSPRLLISKSTSTCTKTFVTVPSAPSTIGIIVIFIFQCFFQFISNVSILTSLFASFQFYSVFGQNGTLFCWLLLLLLGFPSLLFSKVNWCGLNPNNGDMGFISLETFTHGFLLVVSIFTF